MSLRRHTRQVAAFAASACGSCGEAMGGGWGRCPACHTPADSTLATAQLNPTFDDGRAELTVRTAGRVTDRRVISADAARVLTRWGGDQQ